MPTDLNAMVRDVVEAFQSDRRYDTEVVVDAAVVPGLMLDQDQFRTVLWNLLLNAAQHMPQGGVISIVVQAVGKRVRLLVKDGGSGIPASELPHVWDPFYTRRSGGTGLGLATVERVVRAHDGEVWVHSTEGAGTTFGIWLPVESDPGTQETTESA